MSKRGVVERRITDLWRRSTEQEAVTTADQFGFELNVICSCPPSTAVRVLTGIIHENVTYRGWRGGSAQVPENVLDFADPAGSKVDGLTLNFSNADYYVGLIFSYYSTYVFYHITGDESLYNDIIFRYNGAETEYATAAEAEEYIDNVMLNGYTELCTASQMPLWAVVLRNNGVTGVDGQVLPVDPVNRGRSYLLHDCRPRNRLVM